ncbi:MAG: L-2-hydroxyglutarate oxidase [Planctomycetota bacterium]|nr:L-2-hydroxyglutarate oxidase [Planctomycetota bacterium]
MSRTVDVLVVGGGIVGLATAYRLLARFPKVQIALVEKEAEFGQHQTGHNSGVLHSGIYYQPGSLKALNCRAGKKAMEAFCAEHAIPFDICGKVIVATEKHELPLLDKIFQRGLDNGVLCEKIDSSRLRELEPHAAGIAAIHVPETGIVDYVQVCHKLASLLGAGGTALERGTRVIGMRQQGQQVIVSTSQGEFVTRWVVNCAGLYSDRVARQSGQDAGAKIIPFRGEYFELKPEAEHLCRSLIYPVPDPNFPFLGVHFTRMIQGGVECGPNAVLALAREGYRKTDIHWGDLWESLTYPGFLKLAARYWRMGAGEIWRSLNKGAFVRALQRLVPEIRSEHLVAAPAGVRAQAVTRNGQMVDDFLICETERVINICNAPSPAATSSLNIGESVVDRLAPRIMDSASVTR